MKIVLCIWTAMTLQLVVPAAFAERPLETIPPDEALADVQARDGVEHDRLSLNFASFYLEDRLRGMIDSALEAQEG